MTQEIVIELNPLAGKSNRSADSAHRYQERFQTRDAKSLFIRQALEKGSKSFFLAYDLDLLKSLKDTGPTQIYATVPNVAQYVREANNSGPVAMGLRRLMQLGTGVLPLAPTALSNVLGVLGKDFSSILVVLTEIEMIEFRRLRPQVVFLHPQMSDLFLANGNYKPIAAFAEFIRRKHEAEPGIFTNNVGQMLQMLEDYDSNIRHVCTPINPLGYMMRPDKERAEAYIRRSQRTITGYDVTCAGTIGIENSVEYAESLGIKRVVIELDQY